MGLKHATAALNAALGAWDALVRGAADAYERVVSLLLNWLGFTVVSDDLVGSAMVVLADADRWLAGAHVFGRGRAGCCG